MTEDFSAITYTPKPYTLNGPAPLPWSPPRPGTGIRVRSKVSDGFVEIGTEGLVLAWNKSVMRVYWPDGTSAVMAASELEKIGFDVA